MFHLLAILGHKALDIKEVMEFCDHFFERLGDFGYPKGDFSFLILFLELRALDLGETLNCFKDQIVELGVLQNMKGFVVVLNVPLW